MNRYSNLMLLILLLVLFSNCDRTNNSPGFDYFPDMAYSQAYETNSENPNFSDGATMQNPVDGTIARETDIFPYKKNDLDRIKAGIQLKNPFSSSNSLDLNRGKKVFEVYCKDCHGEKGDGKGYLFTSGKYPYPPASLVGDKVKSLKDGEIFHTITVGFGIMGAHGSQIRSEDRWKAILYIRNNLQKNK